MSWGGVKKISKNSKGPMQMSGEEKMVSQRL